MNTQMLHGRIASLESKVDMMEAELSYLNEILIRCGFPDGIQTLKMTVEEILVEDAEIQENPHSL
jgi:hypothetical protein